MHSDSKCGASATPISKIMESSSFDNLFCNAHARSLDYKNILLKEVNIICDDRWKL